MFYVRESHRTSRTLTLDGALLSTSFPFLQSSAAPIILLLLLPLDDLFMPLPFPALISVLVFHAADVLVLCSSLSESLLEFWLRLDVEYAEFGE